MPELPEVETIRIGLERLLKNKKISKVDFNWPKSFPNDSKLVNKFLINATIKRIIRRGKAIIIELNTDYSLVIHLKMTGQLVYRSNGVKFGGGHPTDSLLGSLPDKSTRVTIEFSDSSFLFFNDQRKFGWIKLIPTDQVLNIPFFLRLGPEPLEPDFNEKLFTERLGRRSKTSIKAVLLDQSVIAGIGNIYADESLWESKIHPTRLVGGLSSTELSRLHKAIIKVMNLSLSNGGSTDRNYVDAEGNRGNYLKFANVFRREGSPCNRCGNTIIKIRVAGRGTHICPFCQI